MALATRILLFVLLSWFGVVYCLAVPSSLTPDNNQHKGPSPELDVDYIVKSDEDEIMYLKGQVYRLQQQIDEIYRSFATLDPLSKNPGMTVRIHEEDRGDVSEGDTEPKIRRRRDGDTAPAVQTTVAEPRPEPVPDPLAANRPPQTWNPTYNWNIYSGQLCNLCPAGKPGPRGPPGPAGMPGRDGRDGGDAPLQPVETPDPTPFLSTTETPDPEASQPQPEPERTVSQNASIGGVVYTRWGKQDCPPSAELVYTGSVAGAHYTHAGSGSNYLCMPMEPIYDDVAKTSSTDSRALLYSSEYEISGFLPFSSLHDQTPACAVCKTPHDRMSKLMIPGRNVCPSDDWRLEYSGYLMADYYGHKRTEFVCMDGDAEAIPESEGNQNGALFYMVEVRCMSGSGLHCPPYVEGYEVTCAVCTI